MTKPQGRKGRRLRRPSKRGGFLAGLLAFALLVGGLLFAANASAHSRSHDHGSHSAKGHSSGKHHDHGSWQPPGKGYHHTPQPNPGGQTKTVSWVMVDASGSATHITFPQDELSPKHNPAAPTCGHTIQTDVYKYGTSQDKQTVDGLINSGVLNAGGDSSVYISAHFAKQPACKTTSPKPTPSKTPTPTSHKVTLCHARPADTAKNGWVVITIDDNGVQGDKKVAGHANEHDADIIPAFTYSDGTQFSGKNLGGLSAFGYTGVTGQQVLANGCVLPATPSTTPPPTKSTTPPPPPTTSTTPVTPPPTTTTTVVPPPTQSTTTVPPTHTKSTTPAPTPSTTTATPTTVVSTTSLPAPPPGNTGDSAPSSPIGKILLAGVLAVLVASGVAYVMLRRGRHA